MHVLASPELPFVSRGRGTAMHFYNRLYTSGNVKLRHWQRYWDVSPGSRPSSCVLAASKSGETEADRPNRLSHIFEMYSEEELESQKEELEARQSRRRTKEVPRGSRRHEPNTSYAEGQEEEEKKYQKYFYRVEDGTWRPRVGVHGGDVPRWWALRVTIGREKQTCTAIERRYQQLREALGDPEDMQAIETWDISKRVRAWSPKTEKMGNKMVRYDGGGWVMLRANLDSHIAGILRGNINILGFHHREVFHGEEFPLPANDELLAELQEWENNLDPILEEQVREEMGLPPPPPVSTDLDFDEDRRAKGKKGQRSQKRTGLFSAHDGYDSWEDSTNDWYGGDSTNDDSWSEEMGNMWEQDGNSGWLAEPGESTSGSSRGLHVGASHSKRKSSDADEIWGLQVGNADDSNLGGWLNEFDDQAASDWSDLESKSGDDDLAWWDDGDGGDEPSASSAGTMEASEKIISSSEKSPGAAIEVTSGEFKDFEGVVLENLQGSDKVKAEIDVFGKPTVVFLDKKDFMYL